MSKYVASQHFCLARFGDKHSRFACPKCILNCGKFGSAYCFLGWGLLQGLFWEQRHLLCHFSGQTGPRANSRTEEPGKEPLSRCWGWRGSGSVACTEVSHHLPWPLPFRCLSDASYLHTHKPFPVWVSTSLSTYATTQLFTLSWAQKRGNPGENKLFYAQLFTSLKHTVNLLLGLGHFSGLFICCSYSLSLGCEHRLT